MCEQLTVFLESSFSYDSQVEVLSIPFSDDEIEELALESPRQSHDSLIHRKSFPKISEICVNIIDNMQHDQYNQLQDQAKRAKNIGSREIGDNIESPKIQDISSSESTGNSYETRLEEIWRILKSELETQQKLQMQARTKATHTRSAHADSVNHINSTSTEASITETPPFTQLETFVYDSDLELPTIMSSNPESQNVEPTSQNLSLLSPFAATFRLSSSPPPIAILPTSGYCSPPPTKPSLHGVVSEPTTPCHRPKSPQSPVIFATSPSSPSGSYSQVTVKLKSQNTEAKTSKHIAFLKQRLFDWVPKNSENSTIGTLVSRMSRTKSLLSPNAANTMRRSNVGFDPPSISLPKTPASQESLHSLQNINDRMELALTLPIHWPRLQRLNTKYKANNMPDEVSESEEDRMHALTNTTSHTYIHTKSIPVLSTSGCIPGKSTSENVIQPVQPVENAIHNTIRVVPITPPTSRMGNVGTQPIRRSARVHTMMAQAITTHLSSGVDKAK